jgi:hypothetical protein
MNSMSNFKFAVGICAFNEEKNICFLLQRFTVPTSSIGDNLISVCRLKPNQAFYMLLGIFLGVTAYLQVKMNPRNGNIPYIWEPIESTKISIQVPNISQV